MRRLLQIGIWVAAFVGAYWSVSVVTDDPYDPVTADQVRELNGSLVDLPARGFLLHDLEGNPHSLGDLRGRVVFLNFWATWCPPCVEEIPSMLSLARGQSQDEFIMLAVTQDDDHDALISFLREAGMTSNDVLILQDPGGELTRAYGTQLLPETYVIDRAGTVVARFMGPRDWSSEPALRLIQRLLRPPWKST